MPTWGSETGGESRVRAGARAVLLLFLALSLLLCLGADAGAKGDRAEGGKAAGGKGAGSEDETADVKESRSKRAPQPMEIAWPRSFVSLFWLVPILLVTLAWLKMLDWTARDAKRVGAREVMWNSVVLLAGLGGMSLALLVHRAFFLTMVAGVAGVFGGYVHTRNQLVAEDQKVFTRDHLAFVLSSVLKRIGVKVSASALSGRPEDRTRIELLRKDGRSLEAIAESSRAGQGRSEAVLSVKEMIENAVLSRATDIHIEPKQNELQIRYRIDGILHNAPSYPLELTAPMISSMKVLADMDIAERRKPQDGSFAGRLDERRLEFRAASAPSMHGETMTLRILDNEQGILDLDILGFSGRDRQRMSSVISAPHGMLIVSGPTGSGKSTTLYALLSELDAYQKNIMTIENPIEYRLANVTQTAVNPRAGVTFAGTLRSMLRQDPDVIMVGEIRDAETAQVALQAAMTGHFVYTTIHANDSVTSLFRLLDLGVEAYLIASALSGVLAQRLVRLLCDNCKVPYVPKPEFLSKVGLAPGSVQEFFKAQGCEECQGTGYRGRQGVFELMLVNDAIRDLVRGNPSVQLIKAEARKGGTMGLVEDGLTKVVAGRTSIKELMRVTK